METITVKVKFRIDSKKTKSVKVIIEHPRASELSFPEIVDGIYKTSYPKLNELFGAGYIIGAEQVFD